jgi:hypothetical protein
VTVPGGFLLVTRGAAEFIGECRLPKAYGYLACAPPRFLLLFAAIGFQPDQAFFLGLKVMIPANYDWIYLNYRSFGDYLVWAIGCDRFARFRHAAGIWKESSNAFGDGYGFGNEKLRRWERGTW